jgi:hypothetical protein
VWGEKWKMGNGRWRIEEVKSEMREVRRKNVKPET